MKFPKFWWPHQRQLTLALQDANEANGRLIRLSHEVMNQRDGAVEEARRLRQALALAQGTGFVKATGRYATLKEVKILGYEESRSSVVGQRIDLTCTLTLAGQPDHLVEINDAGYVDFRGLEWKVVSCHIDQPNRFTPGSRASSLLMLQAFGDPSADMSAYE